VPILCCSAHALWTVLAASTILWQSQAGAMARWVTRVSKHKGVGSTLNAVPLQLIGQSFAFYEVQRAGPLPPDMRFPWRGDTLKNRGGGSLDGAYAGGYFDAGDHLKFMLPMAYSVARLTWLTHAYKSGLEKTYFDVRPPRSCCRSPGPLSPCGTSMQCVHLSNLIVHLCRPCNTRPQRAAVVVTSDASCRGAATMTGRVKPPSGAQTLWSRRPSRTRSCCTSATSRLIMVCCSASAYACTCAKVAQSSPFCC
jgi:Glycosyl hydrolase family 9